MQIPDVNILVHAYREDAPDHAAYKAWLETLINAPAAFGLPELVLSGFLRIVTHPRVFNPPSPLANAIKFAEHIRSAANCIALQPGLRHWSIFEQLCRQVNAKGNLVPDAYFAALAIENGGEWISADRDFSRFEGLRWRHPLGD